MFFGLFAIVTFAHILAVFSLIRLYLNQCCQHHFSTGNVAILVSSVTIGLR